MKDFRGEDFVAFTQQSQTGQFIIQGMAEQGIAPKVVVEAATAQTVSECVAAGMGAAVMSPIFVPDFLPDLQVRPLKQKMVVPILATRLSLGRMSDYVDRYIDLFRTISVSD
ncbi:LysR substrate-binding domain-containing protein [Phaeobacter sp. J2-8]|uniref:LysR substrate-binding domain-containing protein n=1 Tax=Phaeobacter sp. J2-8 TaxID=2931394 RepID=UPI0024554891|nr:LysR substrate-binding domain-containing protein [Phaeobacter sp. J2-8]